MNELVSLENLDSQLAYWKKLSSSAFIPVCFRGRPEDIYLALEFGKSLGLYGITALGKIAVINGKPSIYGDAMLGICRAHPDFKSIEETLENEDNLENTVAICKVKRGEQPIIISKFSYQDAKTAGLIARAKPDTPWHTYPKRMLQMRARGFALRDCFADALNGTISVEEAKDIPVEGEIKFINSPEILELPDNIKKELEQFDGKILLNAIQKVSKEKPELIPVLKTYHSNRQLNAAEGF